ncbi:MAG: hypothetical protein JSS66_18980 [Armatimonadetes bacterium]|nr:hypothetical protein [Armatimonadota bacterium]
MKSVRDLYNRALELLGVAAAGQTPEAEDWAVMRSALPPLLDELCSLDVIAITINGDDEETLNIPDAAFNGLAILLANEAGPAFGIPAASGDAREGMIQRVRRVTYGQPQYFPQQATYF